MDVLEWYTPITYLSCAPDLDLPRCLAKLASGSGLDPVENSQMELTLTPPALTVYDVDHEV